MCYVELVILFGMDNDRSYSWWKDACCLVELNFDESMIYDINIEIREGFNVFYTYYRGSWIPTFSKIFVTFIKFIGCTVF